MCGIFGVIFPNGQRKVDAQRAVASLRHRGPDGHGIVEGQGYLLGHTRLAVIDLSSAASQPMVSSDGQVVVVFNGEIYNHRDLRRELEDQGVAFRSRSDTEVILSGYRVWGPDVVRRLDGMFAIGIFDVTQQRLLLARDRVGKKPLFYWYQNGELRFASEPKAIFASGVLAEVDTETLPALLSFGYLSAPRSAFRGVSQLAPGAVLSLERDREAQIDHYWKPGFAKKPLTVPLDEAIVEVRRRVIEAVERRLEADVPLGAFLSGGLDSTIVVGVMARLLGRKVKTFSLGFEGDSRYDETSFARQAAKVFETDHQEFVVKPEAMDILDDLVRAHDAPFGDSSAIPMSIVSRLARSQVTVSLTGDGGDDIFCGYNRFLVTEALERLPSGIGGLAKKIGAFLPPSGSERSRLGQVRRLLALADSSLSEKLTNLHPYFGSDSARLLRPELRSTAALPSQCTDRVLSRSWASTPLARILDHGFQTYLPDDLLVKADRSSMMHSLELRSPFLDTALIEYVSELPDSYRRRGLTKKYILRRAFEDIVPKAILHRPKMGFGVPLGAWFRGGAKALARERLAEGARIYDFILPEVVSRLLSEHDRSAADHSHRLWLLLTLETWLDQLPN